jgi:hypothetical protein
MLVQLRSRVALLAMLFAVALTIGLQTAAADDVVHALSGVVKSVDKASKTVVVKTADGTEETVKYTSKTTVEGTKDAGKAVEKGSAETFLGAKKGTKVTIHYTEKAGKKTAVGVKDAVD